MKWFDTMKIAFLLIPLTLLSAGLTGCGPQAIDSDLRSYVRKFEKEANVKVASSVQFKELDSGLVGLCDPDLIRNEVWIDPRAWAETEGDESTRELIVFHELGHCELNRPHNNRLDAEGNPVSVMHKGPLTRMVEPYSDKREDYLDELFGH